MSPAPRSPMHPVRSVGAFLQGGVAHHARVGFRGIDHEGIAGAWEMGFAQSARSGVWLDECVEGAGIGKRARADRSGLDHRSLAMLFWRVFPRLPP